MMAGKGDGVHLSRGIDYGLGRTNIDRTTGIRYGVLPFHAITQAWSDGSEAHYGDPHCPKCGDEAREPDAKTGRRGRPRNTDLYERARGACGDYVCDHCRYAFDGDEAFGDPQMFYVGEIVDGELTPDGDGYMATQSQDDCDIFILKSKYYTRAAFCSPCAPGACYLESPDDGGDKAYCFGADWFDEENPCPYPVYEVSTNVCVYTPKIEAEKDLTTAES